MYDVSYEGFRKFFSYLLDKEVITIEEHSDLLTEYLQNRYVTFDNLSEIKSKKAKTLFQKYANGNLNIE
tara:strand:- start:3665 stop:3871 length:207 start_codon:yes stop_codon:yes gene_type:complete